MKSLLFTPYSTQCIVIPRSPAVDNQDKWSTWHWLYTSSNAIPPGGHYLSVAGATSDDNNRTDFWKKAHDKRVGIDGAKALLLKQNTNAGLIQQQCTNFFAIANHWYCVGTSADCTVPVGHCYGGDLTTAVTLTTPDGEDSNTGGPSTAGQDAYDSGGTATTAPPGDIIIGNERSRKGTQRGFRGGIAVSFWWSRILSLAEFQAQWRLPYPVSRTNLEGEYYPGRNGRGKVLDYSGNARHAYVYGGV